MALDDVDARTLAFEKRWWRSPSAKEQAIRDELGMGAVEFYAVLNRLLDDPAALLAEPQLVARLRRVRAVRQRQRAPRRVA